MKSILRFGVISAVISLAFGQLENNEPTHIIKFKTLATRTAANNMLLGHHRDFLRAVRMEFKNDTDVFSAAAVEQVMSLDQISLGSDFVAVAGVFSDHAFLEYLYQQNSVDFVEENQIFKSTTIRPTKEEPFVYDILKKKNDRDDNEEEQDKPITKEDVQNSRDIKSSTPANWGLSRINQHQKDNSNEYKFDANGGAGVDVYVLDTGVYAEHLDFGGRATHSANMIKNEDENDMGGHGTHVSGKIAGQEYGVAKKANIRSVKILNKVGDGSTSGLLKGIEHVIQNAVPGKSLVNLSLSGPKSRMLDKALNTLVVDYNIPVFVSAGNAGTDACFFSPSCNPNVFSVGATDINDNVPTYSNVGECVAMYAPGSGIVSSYIGGADSSKSMDGTSMASPHVAGIAANLMSKRFYASVQELYDDMKALATKDTVNFDSYKTSSPSNNLLAFNQV